MVCSSICVCRWACTQKASKLPRWLTKFRWNKTFLLRDRKRRNAHASGFTSGATFGFTSGLGGGGSGKESPVQSQVQWGGGGVQYQVWGGVPVQCQVQGGPVWCQVWWGGGSPLSSPRYGVEGTCLVPSPVPGLVGGGGGLSSPRSGESPPVNRQTENITSVCRQ